MGRIGIALTISFASFVFGCGSVKDSGGVVDSSIDSPPGVDADLSGNATVVTEAAVFGGTVGANVGNIDIISMLPNNTVLEMKQTDAGGNATIKVYPGGSVTAVYKHTIDMGAELITWVGVKPGDTLKFGSRNFNTSGQPFTPLAGTQQYTWVAQAGATNYCVFTSCNSSCFGNVLSGSLQEFNTCHKEPMDVMFIAITGSNASHFNIRQNQTYSSTTAINNSGWAVMQNATVNATGLPPEVTNINGFWSSVLDASTDQSFTNGYSGTPTGGAFTGMFLMHNTGDRTMARASLARAGGYQAMQVLDQFNPGTLSQTIASPTLAPWVQGAFAVSSGLRMASWFYVPDAATKQDGTVIRMSWNHVVNAMSNFHQWHIIMPPNTFSIVLPKLPSQFNDNLPATTDSINGAVRTFDITGIDGYDAVRMQQSGNIMCIDCAMRAGDFTRAVFSGNVN